MNRDKKSRRGDQAVDAFSAPKELLRTAQLKARELGMTKSGFYRYCLAKELGYSAQEAANLAVHASIGNFTIIDFHSNGKKTG